MQWDELNRTLGPYLMSLSLEQVTWVRLIRWLLLLLLHVLRHKPSCRGSSVWHWVWSSNALRGWVIRLLALGCKGKKLWRQIYQQRRNSLG